ncbi:MAG TPA: hypothetical protein VNA16_02925 [Abditibacteriaceae bacterium]|nr:hypothetical protein [Abditibacteriaceae bacterium]
MAYQSERRMQGRLSLTLPLFLPVPPSLPVRTFLPTGMRLPVFR